MVQTILHAMYLIYTHILLLYGISVHLCLPPETLEYIEIGNDDGDGDGSGSSSGSGDGSIVVDLDWNESNELSANQTNYPNNIDELDGTTTETITVPPNGNATAKLKLANDETYVVDNRTLELSAVLKQTIHRIRQKYKKIDIIFLIDSSSSVGKSNFRSELRFVIKFLSDFNVSYNYTRVSILTFSSQEKIVRTNSLKLFITHVRVILCETELIDSMCLIFFNKKGSSC